MSRERYDEPVGPAGARRNWLIWFAVGPAAIWAVIRLLRLDSGFPLAAAMAFTPYVLVAAFLAAGVALALENWAAAAIAAAVTLSLAAVVLPRAIGDGTVDAAGRETVTVLSANVHFGTADPKALLALVRRHRPDVLAIQEMTPSFARELDRVGIGRPLPESLRLAAPGAAGSGVYSRLPLRRLSQPIPDESGGQGYSILRLPQVRLRLDDGRALRLTDVHPYPPDLAGTGEWEAVLEHLPGAGSGSPWILAGDFNGGLDQSAFAEVVDRGYRDAGAVAGQGLKPTFPAGEWESRMPPVTIDHVLLDRRLDLVEYGVDELPGSDHRAIHATIALP